MKKTKEKFKYEIEVLGIVKDFKRKTNDIQSAFLDIAEEIKDNLFIGGAEIILREGNKEARISLSAKKINIFKNNLDTRKFTEDYLVEQIKQQ